MEGTPDATTVMDYLDYNNSVSNDSILPMVPFNERPETYIVPILFLIIFIVGVLGNGTLIIIFIRHRTMRNVPNTYILSLALADLLVILTSVPFTSIIYTVETYPWGESICKVTESAKDISISVSIFTLTALSADRYCAIVDPLKKLQSTGITLASSTVVIAVAIWILSIVTAIPTVLGSHIMSISMNDENTSFLNICYPFRPEWLDKKYPQVMVLLKFIMLYLLPLCIIGIFYMKMAKHLIVSTRNVPGEMQGTQRQIQARKKVAHTVLLFVVVFAVCFLPQHVFMLWFYLSPDAADNYNEYWHATRIIGFCLSYLNSCVNPIALYWISGTFRKHFNRYLLCKRTRPRCDTLQGGPPHATSMSLVSMKRHQSVVGGNSSRRGVGGGAAAGTSAGTSNSVLTRRHQHQDQQPLQPQHQQQQNGHQDINGVLETSVLLCEENHHTVNGASPTI